MKRKIMGITVAVLMVATIFVSLGGSNGLIQSENDARTFVDSKFVDSTASVTGNNLPDQCISSVQTHTKICCNGTDCPNAEWVEDNIYGPSDADILTSQPYNAQWVWINDGGDIWQKRWSTVWFCQEFNVMCPDCMIAAELCYSADDGIEIWVNDHQIVPYEIINPYNMKCIQVPLSYFNQNQNHLNVKVRDEFGDFAAGIWCLKIWCRTDCRTTPDNLVAWWPFDETSGDTAHDTIGTNDGNYVTGKFGKLVPTAGEYVDNCLKISGHAYDSYIEVPDNPSLDVGTGDFSVDAWIRFGKPDPYETGEITLLDKYNSNTQEGGYKIWLQRSPYAAEDIYFKQLAPGGPGWTILSKFNPTPHHKSFDMHDHQWHFIAMCVDRDAETHFYVDGAKIGTSPTQGPSLSYVPNLDNAENLKIGASRVFADCGAAPTAAYIDELELYKRCLTEQEIKDLYSAGKTGKCKCRLDITNIHRKIDLSSLLTFQKVCADITNHGGLECSDVSWEITTDGCMIPGPFDNNGQINGISAGNPVTICSQPYSLVSTFLACPDDPLVTITATAGNCYTDCCPATITIPYEDIPIIW